MPEPEKKIIAVDGTETGVADGGDAAAQPIVFLHGGTPGITPYASGTHVWSGVPGRFAGRHRVVAIDLLGSGRTGYPDRPALIDDYGRHALATLAALGVEGAHVVGHDLGGAVAFWLGAKGGGRIASLTVVASAEPTPLIDSLEDLTFLNPPGRDYDYEMQRWAYDRVSYCDRHIDGALMAASLAAAAAPGVTKARHFMADPAALPRLTASIGRLKAEMWTLNKTTGWPVPVQYIWGANDPLTPRERGFKLFETLGRSQPHCQFHLVPRCGSFVFREHPEHFVDLVDAFVDGLAETPDAFTYP